jgi:hypothetical protein
MTLLSITASFGTMIGSSGGQPSGLLNFEPLGYTIAGNPIIMFSVIFGLSMDYEVLLLSRIQESYRRTGDNTASVAEGLAKTAGVITGAALIMVSVFAAFALAEVITIKSIGVGMAIAVAVDATIVRVLLVPATMRLMGKWNWWAPGILGRFVDRLGFSHVEDEVEWRPSRRRREPRPVAPLMVCVGATGRGRQDARPCAPGAADAPDPRRRVCPETVARLRARFLATPDVVTSRADTRRSRHGARRPGRQINGSRTPDDLGGVPKLRWIQVRSAGVNHLADDPPWRHGIAVTNARGVYSIPIGEYVSGMVLRVHQPIETWSADQLAHRWPDDPQLISIVRGKTGHRGWLDRSRGRAAAPLGCASSPVAAA